MSRRSAARAPKRRDRDTRDSTLRTLLARPDGRALIAASIAQRRQRRAELGVDRAPRRGCMDRGFGGRGPSDPARGIGPCWRHKHFGRGRCAEYSLRGPRRPCGGHGFGVALGGGGGLRGRPRPGTGSGRRQHSLWRRRTGGRGFGRPSSAGAGSGRRREYRRPWGRRRGGEGRQGLLQPLGGRARGERRQTRLERTRARTGRAVPPGAVWRDQYPAESSGVRLFRRPCLTLLCDALHCNAMHDSPWSAG